jgi:hypothetical protein
MLHHNIPSYTITHQAARAVAAVAERDARVTSTAVHRHKEPPAYVCQLCKGEVSNQQTITACHTALSLP